MLGEIPLKGAGTISHSTSEKPGEAVKEEQEEEAENTPRAPSCWQPVPACGKGWDQWAGGTTVVAPLVFPEAVQTQVLSCLASLHSGMSPHWDDATAVGSPNAVLPETAPVVVAGCQIQPGISSPQPEWSHICWKPCLWQGWASTGHVGEEQHFSLWLTGMSQHGDEHVVKPPHTPSSVTCELSQGLALMPRACGLGKIIQILIAN